MSHFIRSYLRDHHAGAVAGLELARRTARSNAGNEYGAELERIANATAEDLGALKQVMSDRGIQPSRLADRAAWTAEKLGRLKRNGTWISPSPLSRVIELEGLIMLVSGKAALWEALKLGAPDDEGRAELQRLEERARDHREQLSELHRRATRELWG